MSIPKEPRQLMINLMYLVLTAMLALNVSNEILHAFKIINNSIVKSNESIAGQNNETLVAFDANQEMEGHRDRVKPFNDKAKEVHARAEEIYKYLDSWKTKIIAEADQIPADKANIATLKREDNIDASTRLLVEKKGGNEIKAKLEELRAFMLNTVDPADKASFEKELPLQITEPPKSDNNPRGDWSTGTFHNIPTLAAVTLFAKMQNDIRTSESAIIRYLFSKADATQMKFDAIIPVAVPRQSYLLAGQPVEAQIMVAAYNKSANPQISASSGSVTVQGGIGTWKGTASGVGRQVVNGRVRMNLGDRMYDEPFKFEYMVGTAGASMQLDKMNVFYIGVPNPITVTAAGYSLEDVAINIPGATVTKTGNGKYDINVTQATGQRVTAAITAGGKQVGAMEVRVKRIPDPVAKVAGKAGSIVMPANVFRAQLGIAAALENFDFDARFQVTSYSFSYLPKGRELQDIGNVNGALFSGNPQVLNYVQKQAKIGDRIFIDNIRAIGPDRTARALGTITILLN
jgi:gliding motility-associated protein GldM